MTVTTTSATATTVPLVAVTRETPGGPLSLLLDGEVVVAAGFTDPATLAARLPAARRDRGWSADVGVPAVVATAVDRFAAGEVAALDALAVDQDGTEFQQAVWGALREIPAGHTATYAELAASIGRPKATRAVGSACGANLVAPLIPCHRAIRSDGSLGGYEYGLDAKRWLLTFEAPSG